MKTLSLEQSQIREVQFATLADSRRCTKLAWNKDGSRMALVIDERQIYLWNITSNNFTQLRPRGNRSSESDNTQKRIYSGDIGLITWSKISDKLAICYSTGQLVIYNLESQDTTEKFIDNSTGVLAQISQIEVSSHTDLFAGITVIFEILVMTFDGEAKFYVQTNSRIIHLKFSQPYHDNYATTRKNMSPNSNQSWPAIGKQARHNFSGVWLSYQTSEDKILFVKISMGDSGLSDLSFKTNFLFDVADGSGTMLIDHFWMNESQLICCLSSGCIKLLEIKIIINKESVQFTSSSKTIFNIREEPYLDDQTDEANKAFKAFELRHRSQHVEDVKFYSLTALTAYELFYYELFILDDPKQPFSFERVDDINLGRNLKKTAISLEQASWCHDCSMLAVQLTSGHILIYRTSLQAYVVTSFGSKAAYLSGPSEITVLDYKFDSSDTFRASASSPEPHSSRAQTTPDSQIEGSEKETSNALVLNVDLKPSLIAVGPTHLAVALNNRVRYYLVASVKTGHLKSEGSFLSELEYSTIVVDLQLCSRYVAVRFDDGRLKLHALRSTVGESEPDLDSHSNDNSLEADVSNERFFPDPGEKISGFTLTESLFIYCTQELRLIVFDLLSWSHIQSQDHSKLLDNPIIRLVANDRGNRFICILQAAPKKTNRKSVSQQNVYLYDLLSNSMVSIPTPTSLYSKIHRSQLRLSEVPDGKVLFPSKSEPPKTVPKLCRVIDALWDSEGRSLILIEQDRLHTVVVLDHTIEDSRPTIEYVDSAPKATSHKAIYLSQGIVSFQTRLGRMINSILTSHDDEIKLTILEKQIEQLKSSFEDQEKVDLHIARLEMMKLKLEYFTSILSIYSLSKCKQICEHLVNDEQLSLRIPQDPKEDRLDRLLWRQLAARGLYCMDLEFAAMIYKQQGFLTQAFLIDNCIKAMRSDRAVSRSALRSTILEVLGCVAD